MPEVMVEGGFDVVIGNPPYQGSSDQKTDYVKKVSHFYDANSEYYDSIFGMRHNLYQLFTMRGMELCKKNGVYSYITSRTFLNIGSKLPMRKILQSYNLKELLLVNEEEAFDATVNPAIFSVKKQDLDEYNTLYIDAIEMGIDSYTSLINLKSTSGGAEKIFQNKEGRAYSVPIEIYKNAIRNSFFEPTHENLEINKRFMRPAGNLADKWSSELMSSTNMENNIDEVIENHYRDLDEGDVTILGLLTIGGNGLRTADNEEHLAYIDGTEKAEKVKQRNENFEYEKKNENGYYRISRVVKESSIAEPHNLSSSAKLKGIEDDKKWVKMEKGGSESQRFYDQTDTVIDWSKESLKKIKDRKEGRLRDTSYYFRESLFLSRGGSGDLKVRYSDNRVFDNSGNMLVCLDDKYDLERKVDPKYLIGLINSNYILQIVNNFLNSTVNKQISDVRMIPIKIASEDEQGKMVNLVDEAIKRKESGKDVGKVQSDIDNLARDIYGVELDE